MAIFDIYKGLTKMEKIDSVNYADSFDSTQVRFDLVNRGEYPSEIVVIKRRKSPNIRTVLKQAKTVLFNDDEYFNKDVTGIKNLEDLKSLIGIKGNVYKITECGSRYEYKLADSDYKFSILVM